MFTEQSSVEYFAIHELLYVSVEHIEKNSKTGA